MVHQRPIRQVVINNKRWNFRRQVIRETTEDGRPIHGRCDPPETPNKAITVDKRLTGKLEMDTTVHELLHASQWDVLAEEFVEQLGTDITNVLWRMGYRKKPETECPE